MQVDYPFRIDPRGATAAAGDDDHIRDMIEQVLLTSPGERVNRPTFGSGVLGLVFGPNSDMLAAATRLSVQAALQEWLGDVIEVADVSVEAIESTLRIEVQYTVLRNGESGIATVER